MLSGYVWAPYGLRHLGCVCVTSELRLCMLRLCCTCVTSGLHMGYVCVKSELHLCYVCVTSVLRFVAPGLRQCYVCVTSGLRVWVTSELRVGLTYTGS